MSTQAALAQLEEMSSLRRRIRELLINSGEAAEVDRLIAEHASRLNTVIASLRGPDGHAVASALGAAFDEAQSDISAICRLLGIQLKLAGNDLRRSHTARLTVEAYASQQSERERAHASAELA